MSDQAPQNIAFYEFELDLSNGDLRRNGEPVRLAAQPAKALVLLVERAGELVSRSEIQEHVWGDLIIEQQQGLNTCIRQIRSALDDRPDDARFIDTVPRRGYRFIAPIEPIPRPSRAPGEIGDRTQSPRPLRHRMRLLAALAALGLLTVVVNAVRQQPDDPRSVDRPASVSSTGEPRHLRSVLAVLPFDSLGGGPEQEAFALGLTEEIITELARLEPEKLGVVARGSTDGFDPKDFETLGRRLGIDAVLQGTVRRQGRQARIAAQLVRVSDQSHIWAERYDRPVDDVLDVQLEVARRVTEALAPELLPGARRASSIDPRAWEAYLSGRYLLDAAEPRDPVKAELELRRALDIDPKLARAHVALADAYHAQVGGPAIARQREALSNALHIDPELAAAHVRLAKIQLYADWDFDAAGGSFAKAVALAPGDAGIRHSYALYLSHLRQHDRAFRARPPARSDLRHGPW